MRKSITEYKRRTGIFLLAVLLLFSQPVWAGLPGPDAAITQARILKLAKKYDYSAYFLLRTYQKQGRSLTEWSEGRTRLTQVMNVTTHETSHSFMFLPRKATRYYIGNGKSILVPHTKIFRSKRMASSIPSSLRTFRYSTYVGNPKKYLGSDVDGIYGLMNEFTAYCWGMHVNNAMIPYYEKYCTDFTVLTDYLNDCENDRMAYSEFRYYMLHYLYYAKKHAPDVYRGILRNKQFRKAYKQIEKKFAGQIRIYERELKKLPGLLLEKGYTMIVTEDDILFFDEDAWGYNFGIRRFNSDYQKLIKASKRSKYSAIEKKLKK